jgi:hypothetical protein
VATFYSGVAIDDDAGEVGMVFADVGHGAASVHVCVCTVANVNDAKDIFTARVMMQGDEVRWGFTDCEAGPDGDHALTRAEALAHPLHDDATSIVDATLRHPDVVARLEQSVRSH